MSKKYCTLAGRTQYNYENIEELSIADATKLVTHFVITSESQSGIRRMLSSAGFDGDRAVINSTYPSNPLKYSVRVGGPEMSVIVV